MADNKGILIVYNICTLGNNQLNVKAFNQWKKDIDRILEQNLEQFQLIITECRGPGDKSWIYDRKFNIWLEYLKSKGVFYVVTKEYLPFGQAVNYAAKEIVKLKGTYEYYMYWSSGFEMSSDVSILKQIYKSLENNKDICRANIYASNDNYPPKNYDFEKDTTLYTVKPGFKIHDHCSIYTNYWFESFNNCIRPDIFKGNGSEPLFPYMASSLGKRCVILPKQICPISIHHKRLDGKENPGIGNRINQWYIKSLNKDPIYLNSKEISEKSIRCHEANIMMDNQGTIANDEDLTPEIKKHLNHQYGEDGMKLNEKQRKELNSFIKDEFFIKEFDYNKIICKKNIFLRKMIS